MSGDKNWSSEKECKVDGMRKQHQPACHTAGLPYPPPSSWPSGMSLSSLSLSFLDDPFGKVDRTLICLLAKWEIEIRSPFLFWVLNFFSLGSRRSLRRIQEFSKFWLFGLTC